MTPSRIGAVPLSFFVPSTAVGWGVFRSSNRRLGFTCVQLSLSAFSAMLGSCGIEGALVPADDDPPGRSVSPASAIVVASSVTFGGLPRLAKPCPFHGHPFTSVSEETSVHWFEGSLRIVRAMCRPVSVTMMCTLPSSSRPHQKPASQPLSPLKIVLFRFVLLV